MIENQSYSMLIIFITEQLGVFLNIMLSGDIIEEY